MAVFKKALSASLGGGAMLLGAAPANATTVTMSVGSSLPSGGAAAAGPSGTTVLGYYTGGGGANYTTSSANYYGTYTDPNYGLDTYVSSNADYPGNAHGNQNYIGQSFSTGNSDYLLNQISVAFADADSAATFSTTSEQIRIFKLNQTTGNLASVGSYSANGTPYEARSGFKLTNLTFTGGPTLSANSTYVFTVSENGTTAASLVIPSSGVRFTARTNTYSGVNQYSNPAGTTSSQLVSVNDVANGSGEYSFLTYSGYSSRNNSSGDTTESPAETGSDYYLASTTTAINTASLSTGSKPSGSPIGVFNGANSNGIDQIVFDVYGTAVPEPTSLSLLGFAGAGLLARRRRNT